MNSVIIGVTWDYEREKYLSDNTKLDVQFDDYEALLIFEIPILTPPNIILMLQQKLYVTGIWYNTKLEMWIWK